MLKSIKDLKVGMKVYIREGLTHGKGYGVLRWWNHMTCGEIAVRSVDSTFSETIGGDEYFYSNEMIDWDKTNELNPQEVTTTPKAIRCIYTETTSFTKGKVYDLDVEQNFIADNGVSYTHKDIAFGTNIFVFAGDARFEPVEEVEEVEEVVKGEVEMTKEEFFKKYVSGNKVVHCDTEKKAIEFMKLAHKFGFEWNGGAKLVDELSWERYREGTCYNLTYYKNTVLYGPKYHYARNGKKVVPFDSTLVTQPSEPKQSNPVKLPQIKVVSSESDNDVGLKTFIQVGDNTVIYVEDDVVGVARCHPDDEFNLEVGKALAYYRWVKGE